MVPRICYVVNSGFETSVPTAIATALVDHETLNIDILAWFDASPFEGVERIGWTVSTLPNRRPASIERSTERPAIGCITTT
jgi:hypothetical protein